MVARKGAAAIAPMQAVSQGLLLHLPTFGASLGRAGRVHEYDMLPSFLYFDRKHTGEILAASTPGGQETGIMNRLRQRMVLDHVPDAQIVHRNQAEAVDQVPRRLVVEVRPLILDLEMRLDD